jgi:hypothetical protein
MIIESPEALGQEFWKILEPYRVTIHGANPWELSAIVNVLRIRPHIDEAVAAVGGKINSVYRCTAINKAVGGSVRSRHLEGLAVDIRPGPKFNTKSASQLLFALAKDGRLGSVHQVIDETGWVHVGWHRLGERGTTRLLKFDGKRYLRIA